MVVLPEMFGNKILFNITTQQELSQNLYSHTQNNPGSIFMPYL